MRNELELNYNSLVPTLRAKENFDYALVVPSFIPSGFNFSNKIAAIIHIFYTELTENILCYIQNIPVQTDLYISTDTEAKKQEIKNFLKGYVQGHYYIRVFENKGRDIAATFIGFRDVFENYQYFIHLHTKKSLHNEQLNVWRQYLFGSLLGSREIVTSILWLLSQETIGVVFAQHFEFIRPWINWGDEDYYILKKLLSRSGIKISLSNYLDFPSGSMYWARTDIFKSLFSLDLTFSDFSEENGQNRGTLAHAIERSVLFYAENSGYSWLKIARTDLYKKKDALLIASAEIEYPAIYKKVNRSVLKRHWLKLLLHKSVYIYKIKFFLRQLKSLTLSLVNKIR